MRWGAKSLIALGSMIFYMAVLPLVSVEYGEDWGMMGVWMLCFFIVYPALALGLGIVAGTDARHLWWIPFALAALFPPLFAIAIGELVFDLYFYSAIYLPIGLVAMLVSSLISRRKTE